MGKGLKNFVVNRGQGSRIGTFNRVNNIIERTITSPITRVAPINRVTPIHSRGLLIIDPSFETRFLPLLRHLIDIGYVPDLIDIKVVKDNIVDVETVINDYYDKGGRLFFGTQKSSVFIGLRSWFENHGDTLYFNSGSKIWITRIDDHIPDNMFTTACNNNRIVDFIFDNIVCNIHQHFDFIQDTPFDNIFDFVDDSLPNGQVFNQIVYVCDNTDLLLKDNFVDAVKSYIQTNFSQDTQFNDKVLLQTFVLNIVKNDKDGMGNFVFPPELDVLLCENPINGSQFAASKTKSVFIFDCFDSANCQPMLDYFSKKEYSKNIIIFNDKFLNINTDGKPFYSKFDLTYSFILSLSYSELGYKKSRQIFGDYSTQLPFIDIFSSLLDIFERIVTSKNVSPISRLIEYLTNSFSIDRNEWHVKPLYLYGLRETFDDAMGRWNFDSSATIFKKSFNDTNTGTASLDESWMDTAIGGYPTDTGAISYSSNSTNYNKTATTTNTVLNGVSMLFSSLQEITDYSSKLDGFFKGTYKTSTYNGGANPNSTSAVFGIWKCLTNSALVINSTAVPSITINVTVPSQALIDGTSFNKNYWFHVYNGPINYTYKSYDVHGNLISSLNSDTLTIDLDMTYSADNYIVFFNKGDLFNGIRGPLCVYFNLFANQVTNKQYRIGDVVSISSSTLGTNVNASIDSISSDGFTFGVTRFENENTNGITSTVLKTNTGVILSLVSLNSVATMGVNPDITNTANNSLNMWSTNGCYYLALLSSGLLVANDFRTGLTFWSSSSGFSDPGPGLLRFRALLDTSLQNHIIVELLDTSGTVRQIIVNHSINGGVFFPLQLTITNERNIAVLDANGYILWSESSRVYLSLANGDFISNRGNYGSLYSLNGTYNLALSSSGVLNFTNLFSNTVIYSINNLNAINFKFSYTTNTSTNMATFALGLYNSSGAEVYNILLSGTYVNSTTIFDIENNKLVELPFVGPYTCKLSNNGDLVIVDANNNKCWYLGKADKTTVTQDYYAMVSGEYTLTSNAITGISYLHPRQGDSVTIHNPTNMLYSGATATIALVNSDKSIKAVFYDEADFTARSKLLLEKPVLRSSLVTDSGDIRGQNFMPVSNLELFKLTSDNGYFSSYIGNDCIVNVIDNRTGRQMWASSALALGPGQTIRKCNSLQLDNYTGSLYIDVISENIGNSTLFSQNVTLNSNINYTLSFSASSSPFSSIIVTIAPLVANPLQPNVSFTFTPTTINVFQLFTQSFSVVTNGKFVITFSTSTSTSTSTFAVKDISIANNDKYYLFQNSDVSDEIDESGNSYSLLMQDDGNLCLYSNGTDVLWSSMSWQTERWTSSSGIIQAFKYSNQFFPPRLISTNGYYYLTMKSGNLGVMNYNNNGDWVDKCFKYIGNPLFYSGLTGVSVTDNFNNRISVYSSGSLLSNSTLNSYWTTMYNGVFSTFSDGVGKSLESNINWIWASKDATTNTNVAAGTYNFYYTYNNTTGYSFEAELWVSVVQQCDVYIGSLKIATVGGSSSSSWNNLYKYDFTLPPGQTIFKFVAKTNGGSPCGLAFLCIPTNISSCDLFISGNTGNLMAQNVMVLSTDGTTISVPGVSDLPAYSITNFINTGPAPYTMAFQDNGTGSSNGSLQITNSLGSSIFSSIPSLSLVTTINVPSDRNGIISSGIKIFAQQDDSELASFLWSPSGYYFFGLNVDTVALSQSICIFDTRFTKPIYTLYTTGYTTLSSDDAILYVMLSSTGAIVAYNVLGNVLWKTADILNYSNYTNYRMVMDDLGILSILGTSSSTSSITLATFNRVQGYENNMLSDANKSYSVDTRLLTSSNGDYTLTLDYNNNACSLNINSVSSYISSSSSSGTSKDINTTTLYSCLYSYTASSVSSTYVKFDTNGVLSIHDSSGTKMSFGSSNQGVPGYKLVLGNTGELAIYDNSAGPDDLGIQTWASGTAYSETVPHSNYSIDTSDIPENQLVSNEFTFKIPSNVNDTEEYTKMYSQNRLYYLRFEQDGSLAIYLSNSDTQIWSNGRPYSGSNNAARLGFVYGSDGNGTFGLWDSKGVKYGNSISVSKDVVYVFYLGNDRIMRLVGSNGTSVVFNP